MEKTPSPILSGWKEIASYMGKGVRTVQRYENSLALPIHRPSKKLRAAVIARKADLDNWMSANPGADGFFPDRRRVGASAEVDELRRNIAEFGRLRKVNAGSRQGLVESRQALRATLRSVASHVVPDKKLFVS